ncbi:hypothetical protein [Curtobacterium sp. MCBD17_040]|uniref:hypothetical protein n=1 Tax=Curtobacterium sp. MCBD17_040 TaxID=2175674 RepID=UPI0024DFCA3F|nr:hypothetical protein [Curtobacterium sp. MCBD17_040]WIB65811.1 hypothetical protein DEI94_16995 [Curtobacterium sp. MCBD17_040]
MDNTGTGPTLTPVTLSFFYDTTTDPKVSGTPTAWANPTVSSPQTKNCTLNTSQSVGTCVVPPIPAGKSASITVTGLAELSATEDIGVGWEFKVTRTANDPDTLHNERFSSTTQTALRGSFDSATPTSQGVHVRGWAADPAHPYSNYSTIAVTVRGVSVGQLSGGLPRPDVHRALGFETNSGFDGTLPAAGTGKQQVCLSVTGFGDAGALNLGCKTVDFGTGTPNGAFDSITTGPRTITVSGWAYDTNAINSATTITVTTDAPYDDSPKVAGTATANVPRPDVNRVKKVPGNHGFQATFTGTDFGPVTVCVMAQNVGAGSNTILGCKQLDVPLS